MNVEPRSTLRSRDRRGGFTLVELLLTVAIVGILAQIAIPNYQALTLKARAVDAMADVEVVEQAARSYHGDLHRWPSESPTGSVPPGMARHLPDGFSFAGEGFTLDWENLSIPGGLPGDPGTTRILGIAVVTSNAELGQALVDVFGASDWYIVGDSYVRIIDRQ